VVGVAVVVAVAVAVAVAVVVAVAVAVAVKNMPLPVDQLVADFGLSGLKMLNAIMGEGYNPLEEPKDLITLQLLGLGIGKALAGGNTDQMFKNLRAVVDALDVTPIEELIDRL
jgi:hypothetical protein